MVRGIPQCRSLVAQTIAALLVIGSYFWAEYVRIWRPRQQAQRAALAQQSVKQTSAATPASEDDAASLVGRSCPAKR